MTQNPVSYTHLECTEIEDENDPNAADKYTIYLAVVEPNLKEVAQEKMCIRDSYQSKATD